MLEQLKKQVCEANLQLVAEGLVIRTFGNASGVDRSSGCMVIKPSGVSYDGMKPAHMVVLSLDSGEVVEGMLNPSSDTPTHLVLYRAFQDIGGIVHTHSLYATAWAQAGRELPALGTTHADYFHGAVPVTRKMKTAEIQGDYEIHTGRVIVERFLQTDPMTCPAVLLAGHGPFAWGSSAADAVHNAAILEHLSRLAAETLQIRATTPPMTPALLDRHFFRKHGAGAYYGQAKQPKRHTSRKNS